MLIHESLSWVPPRLAPSVPAWLWPRPPMLFGRRDTLAVVVPVLRIRCAGCGHTMSVSFARCPRCARRWGWALLEYVGLRPVQVPVAGVGLAQPRLDDAAAAHIAEAIRDAHAFGEVTIGRADVGLHHDAARLAMFRRERGAR